MVEFRLIDSDDVNNNLIGTARLRMLISSVEQLWCSGQWTVDGQWTVAKQWTVDEQWSVDDQ